MSAPPSPNAPRLLSSRATWLYKFGLTGFYVLAFVSLLGPWFFEDQLRALPAKMRPIVFAMLALWLVVSVAELRWIIAIKRVVLDGEGLLVSNFRDEIRVPLADVVAVSGTRFRNPQRIRLTLRTDTSFGQTIDFVPPSRLFPGFSRHPFADQLRARIAGDASSIPPDRRRFSVWSVAAIWVAIMLVLGASVIGSLRSNEAVQSAFEIACRDPRVVAALGEPIELGWLATGRASLGPRSGHAKVSVPIRGSRRGGDLRVEANRREDVWHHEEISVRLDEGTVIDLVPVDGGEPAGP